MVGSSGVLAGGGKLRGVGFICPSNGTAKNETQRRRERGVAYFLFASALSAPPRDNLPIILDTTVSPTILAAYLILLVVQCLARRAPYFRAPRRLRLPLAPSPLRTIQWFDRARFQFQSAAGTNAPMMRRGRMKPWTFAVDVRRGYSPWKSNVAGRPIDRNA